MPENTNISCKNSSTDCENEHGTSDEILGSLTDDIEIEKNPFTKGEDASRKKEAQISFKLEQHYTTIFTLWDVNVS